MGVPAGSPYSDNEHGGLEVVEPPDYPEAYHFGGNAEAAKSSEGLQVVPGSHPPLERKSSLNQPEAWHMKQDPPDTSEEKEAFVNGRSADEEARPGASDKWHQRRYCGVRGLFLAIALAVMILVVLLGAILGSVLPAKHSPSHSYTTNTTATGNSSTSQSILGSRQALEQSGLATTFLADGSKTLLTYYQDSSNRILENIYVNGLWTSDNQTSTNSSVVQAAGAQSRSPIYAISYALSGVTYRQIFYVADNQGVQTTIAKDSGAWSTPRTIGNSAAPNSPGLAACWGHGNVQGIRLYYGNIGGYIQELAYSFNGSQWSLGYQFPQSDPLTGVGCDYFNNNDGDEYLNVYMRNTTTGLLTQTYWAYPNGWQIGPGSYSNVSIGSGTDIAVTSDGEATEYVLFQNSDSSVTRGEIGATSSTWDRFANMGFAASGSKLAAAYYDEGSMFMYQNSSSDPTIWISDISETGTGIGSLALPGTGED